MTHAKKHLCTLALFATLLCGPSAYGEDSGSKPKFPEGSTMAKLQDKGRITVGVQGDLPGFGQVDPTTGGFTGIDILIADSLGRRLFGADGHVDFYQAKQSRETLLKQGKIDIAVATYTITPARKEVVTFAGPYFNSVNALLVPADDKEVASGDSYDGYKALKGHTMCAGLNSPTFLGLQDAGVEVLGQDTAEESLTALRQGRCRGFVSETAIIYSLLGAMDNPGKYRVATDATSEKIPFGIGLPKGQDDLCAWVNEQLADMIGSGEWLEAFNKTIGTYGVKAEAPATADLTCNK